IGNWDDAGAGIASQRVPVTAVAEIVDPPELFRWFVALREGLGIEIVPLDGRAGTSLVRALGQNRAVALLCDRDIQGAGVEVEFFGERTTLPGGPAILALRTGAPILPTAAYFEPGDDDLAVLSPPLAAARHGRFRDDLAQLTQPLAAQPHALSRRATD